MHAVIKSDIDPSNVVSIHNLASNVVYRYKEYLFCEISNGGVIVIDTECQNRVSVYASVDELDENLDITVGEPTNLTIAITLS